MAITLNDKNVGDVVKINENGTAVNFIIVHKGKPSSAYDESCRGIWLLRENANLRQGFDSNGYNDFENSTIKTTLNGTYLNTIDPKIRAVIKTVKIPFKKGRGNASTGVLSGSDGLSCKVFLLSASEVGVYNAIDEGECPEEGARLSYFLDGVYSGAMQKRKCAADTGAVPCWLLRSPYTLNAKNVWMINENGGTESILATGTGIHARLAFVVPDYLLVDSGGNVYVNNVPTITSDKTGNLGTLTNGFTCHYSVDDADTADNVAVKVMADSTELLSFTAVKNKQYSYSITGNAWLEVTNGKHTYKITASDGKDTVESALTFTRDQKSLSVELASPLASDDRITACALNIEGSVPADAVCKYEVTNNARDNPPVWEDCTAKIRAGLNYVFNNTAAKNGYAFLFRIKITRGTSGLGGYINRITGGFE